VNEIWVIAVNRIAADVRVKEDGIAEQKLPKYQCANEQETRPRNKGEEGP
jgi:hypothetical protein